MIKEKNLELKKQYSVRVELPNITADVNFDVSIYKESYIDDVNIDFNLKDCDNVIFLGREINSKSEFDKLNNNLKKSGIKLQEFLVDEAVKKLNETYLIKDNQKIIELLFG